MFLMKKNGFLGLCLLIISCNTKEKQLEHVMALQQMNDLATVEYVVTKIIKASDNKTWKLRGQRLYFLSWSVLSFQSAPCQAPLF